MNGNGIELLWLGKKWSDHLQAQLKEKKHNTYI
jgi:hypothetical protein